MSDFWIRRAPEPRESMAAGAVAVAAAVTVGAVAWYLTRTLLSREPISLRPEDGASELSAGDSRRLPPGSSAGRPG